MSIAVKVIKAEKKAIQGRHSIAWEKIPATVDGEHFYHGKCRHCDGHVAVAPGDIAATLSYLAGECPKNRKLPAGHSSKQYHVGDYSYSVYHTPEVHQVVINYLGESWRIVTVAKRPCKLRDILDDWTRSEHYGGPGRAFNNRPWLSKRTRKAIVIEQMGGLDI